MHRTRLSEDFYDQIEPRLHRRIGRELRLAGRVLELGCGGCELVRYLAETYRQRVSGVDISSRGFPHSRVLAGGRRIRCIRSNAEHLDFIADCSYDAVVVKWALHEMEHPDAMLREAYRVLRPGGELLIVDFPRGSLAQELWNENYFTPYELKKRLLETGFSDVQVRRIEQDQIIWARGFRPPIVAAKHIGRTKEKQCQQKRKFS